MKKLHVLLSITLLALITIGAKTCSKIPQAPTTNIALATTQNTISYKLLDSDNKPTKELLDLLSFMKIPHDGTLDSIVAATQKAWLRQAGKERWQVEEKYTNLTKELTPFFEKVSVLQEIRPRHQHYDYAVILGATLSGVRMRLAYLADLWRAGLRVNSIIFLVGQRPLDPEQESPKLLLDTQNGLLPFKKDWKMTTVLPTMETDMAKFVYEQADLPNDLRKIPVEFIDTPSQKTAQGTMRRPNTPDTIKTWIKTNPKSGSCLCISTQPHIGYQDAVIRTYLPKTFLCEVVGPAAKSDTKNVEILDALARWLYQENQDKKSI